MQQALGRAGLETTGSDKTLTAEQAIKLSAEIQNAPSYRRLAMPDAIGYARDTVYVRTYAGAFYAILLTSQGPGVPRLLTVAQK
jgi:hypothetical protein